jgi:RimJ/RimL family protein N-acetyltransferase
MTPFAAGLGEPLHALFTDAHVRRYLLDDAVVDRAWIDAEIAASERRFARGDVGLWAVRPAGAPADEVIGFVGLRDFEDPPAPQLVYGLAPAWTGRGAAREMVAAALAEIRWRDGSRVVRAASDAANLASWHLLERLGFRRTGVTAGSLGALYRYELDRA